MKTNAKQRAEFGTAGGVTHYTPDEFTRDLIADVDGAVKLLVAMYNNAPSADEFRLMVRTMGRTTEAAEGLMPQIDRLADTEAEVVDFLKEPDA